MSYEWAQLYVFLFLVECIAVLSLGNK